MDVWWNSDSYTKVMEPPINCVIAELGDVAIQKSLIHNDSGLLHFVRNDKILN